MTINLLHTFIIVLWARPLISPRVLDIIGITSAGDRSGLVHETNICKCMHSITAYQPKLTGWVVPTLNNSTCYQICYFCLWASLPAPPLLLPPPPSLSLCLSLLSLPLINSYSILLIHLIAEGVSESSMTMEVTLQSVDVDMINIFHFESPCRWW